MALEEENGVLHLNGEIVCDSANGKYAMRLKRLLGVVYL